MTWLSFEVAYAVHLFQRTDGIGYALSPDDPYAAADLDGVSEWPDDARPLASKVIASGFYVETTPSGDGLHVWIRGHLPGGVRHKKRFPGTRDAALEVYDHARVVTMTGAAIDGQTVLL